MKRSGRGANRWLWAGAIIAGLGLVLGCTWIVGRCTADKVAEVTIALTGIDAVVGPDSPARLEMTCTVSNANSTWVDIDLIDYCVTVNGDKVYCGKYPGNQPPGRIVANDQLEIRVAVRPTMEDGAKLLSAVANRVGLPVARLEGQARISSPIGNLEFPFVTSEIEVELKRIGVSLELGTP